MNINDIGVDPIIRKYVRTQTEIKITGCSQKGGCGVVYFGKRMILEDDVALKFYTVDDKHMHNEPLLMKDVKHQNILEVFDANFLTPSIAYYIMPMISGGDLQDIIDKKCLTYCQVIKITQGILDGLTELHKVSRNIVHRDLKPLNILIDGENPTQAFISDFGLIKKIPIGGVSVTASEFTFIYRPPESISDLTYNKQSDIYQVGVILFQMLNGDFPIHDPAKFLGKREMTQLSRLRKNNMTEPEEMMFIKSAINNKILNGKLIDLNTLPVYVPLQMRRIIRKAINNNLNQRYQNTAVFMKDLYDCQKTAINWWCDEKGLIHAEHYNRRTYRIKPCNKKGFITEWNSPKTGWRKEFEGCKIEEHIEHLEKL